MTTIESFLASQTVKFVTLPYPRRASYSKRTVNTWCGWNYCYNLCYISFSKYVYNKNNNSIFNISACLINNQSKLYLVYNVFNLSNHTILLTFEGSIIDNYFFHSQLSNGAVWSKLLCLPSGGSWTHISNILCLILPLSYRGIFFVWLTWWYYYNILVCKSQ